LEETTTRASAEISGSPGGCCNPRIATHDGTEERFPMAEPITTAELVAPAQNEATPVEEQAPRAAEPLLEDELLVEDISIDGMCGVY
jgi:mycofactocin precursor